MDKKFKFHWFDGCVQTFGSVLGSFKDKPDLKFLEIGSFEGKSTCWMLDNVLTNESSKITCIDSWQGGEEHSKIGIDMLEMEKNFLDNMSNYPGKVEIIKGLSKDSLISIQNRVNYYDFIYIDGGHTMRDVVTDFVLSFDLLKVGGIMAFDDYLWGSNSDVGNFKPTHMRPELAINCFLIAYQENIGLLHQDGQVWIMKR